MNVAILARDSTTKPIGVGVPPFPNPQYLGIEWDAENRLLAINQGTLRSEFTYDGLDRRVRIVEKSGSTVTSDRRFLWCARAICEERGSSGATVVKRYFSHGVQQAGQAFFYSRDHLGSVRELSDGAAAIKARYDYDPYGKRSAISEDQVADFGFTGHYEHLVSETTLAMFRVYDARFARWISTDPSGYSDGPNLYRYARNNPLRFVDPSGHASVSTGVEYHPYDTSDEVYGNCKDYEGCTRMHGSGTVKCEKKGCLYYPSFSADFTIDVYFLDHPSKPGVFDHEYGTHVESYLWLIDQFSGGMNNFENQGYPSKLMCELAAWAMIQSMNFHILKHQLWNDIKDAPLLFELQ